MKKLTLITLLFFNTALFASLFDLGSRDEPQWLMEYKTGDFEKDDGKSIYFIGISQPYKSSQEKKAIQGARQNGLSQIANYINVSIGSSLKINTVVKNDNLDENLESDISSLSFADLDSIVPSKEFISSKSDTIIGYTLYKITKEELKKKQLEYKRKSEQYSALLEECKKDIQNNDIDLANEVVQKLKGFKQSKYDVEYLSLLKSIEKLFNVNVTSNIRKGKVFKLNEYIKLTLRPSKSVYIYVLQQYGNSKKVKMIFPNEQDNNNYLNAKKSKTLRVKTIRKHLTNSYNQIIIYASYHQIPFINYINNSYELSNKKDAKWQNMLVDREEKFTLFRKNLKYKVDNKKETKAKICLIVEGSGVLATKIVKESKSLFRKSMRVKKCNSADYKITIYYDESSEYEEALEQRIRTITYSYSIDYDGDEIYSSDEINERFYAKDSKSKMMRGLRSDMKLIIKEMISTIKDNR